MLLNLARGCLELLAPPTCAACDSAVDARETAFCGACSPLIERTSHPDAACVFGGPLRDAIHRLKYQGHSELAPSLASWLIEPARRQLVDLVAPVPLHPRRLRERGYNQSALLARSLARALSVSLAPALLKRVRAATAQVGHGRDERARSLAGAFQASPRAMKKRVLVIDDVRTTGATLAEARRALLVVGAAEVYTLALAIADEDV